MRYQQQKGFVKADAKTKQAMKNFGFLLRTARKKTGRTQREVAEAIGISRGWIADMELGAKLPTIEALVHMADFYNYNRHHLLVLYLRAHTSLTLNTSMFPPNVQGLLAIVLADAKYPKSKKAPRSRRIVAST